MAAGGWAGEDERGVMPMTMKVSVAAAAMDPVTTPTLAMLWFVLPVLACARSAAPQPVAPQRDPVGVMNPGKLIAAA